MESHHGEAVHQLMMRVQDVSKPHESIDRLGERRIEKTEVLEMKYKKFMGRDLYAFCCRSEADLSSEMVSEG